MKRHLACILAATAIATPILGLAHPAEAAVSTLPGISDCKNPPVPEDPKAGLPAAMDGGAQKPRDGDPFATPPTTTTVYEQYRWAGGQWTDYDLGCGPDATRDLGATIWGMLANGSLKTLTLVTSATVAITRFGFEPQRVTGILDPIGQVVQSAFGGRLFPILIGYSLIGTGVLLLVRHRRSGVRATAEHAGWAGLVVVAATTSIAWAFSLGPIVDQGITRALTFTADTASQVAPSAQGTTTAGDSLAASLQQAILYRTWIAGVVGSADSPVAKKYGPEMWRASAYTEAESLEIRKDPLKAPAITERKQAAFKDAAAHIQAEDPAAYEYVAGHQNFGRWAYTLLGWLGLAALVPFVAVASMLLIWAVTVFRLTLWLLPVIALFAVAPQFRRHFLRAIDTAVGAIVNGVVFGAVTLVWITATGAILSADANPLAIFVVLLAGEVALWKSLRPWQRIRHATALTGRAGSSAQEPQAAAAPAHTAAAKPPLGDVAQAGVVAAAGGGFTGLAAAATRYAVSATQARSAAKAAADATPDRPGVIARSGPQTTPHDGAPADIQSTVGAPTPPVTSARPADTGAPHVCSRDAGRVTPTTGDGDWVIYQPTQVRSA